MGNHHHHHRKQESGELANLLPLVSAADYCSYRKPTLLRFFVLFAVFSLSFLFVSLCLFPSYSFLSDEQALVVRTQEELPCSSMRDDTLCCDRSARRTDVCFMRGPVRTHSPSNSLLLISSTPGPTNSSEERIRPYTRKWEHNTMSTIDELRLLRATSNGTDSTLGCDVTHDAPAVVFSTGGYTGNVYHEFNDGIVPLYITSHGFDRKVVFVILEYHDWWISKYENILSQLSDYPPVDYSNDKRTHCFPGAVVGLRIHDELAIDASRMAPASNRTIRDFRSMLDEAYKPRIRDIETEEQEQEQETGGVGSPTRRTMPAEKPRPKLVIVSRNGSRGIENEGAVVKLAEDVGFAVEVLRPEKSTELAKIYRALNSSDAMVGVHGAAMTHLLFMRPGTVFVQVVPLGTGWAAESYYGEPAVKLGLKYVRYEISPRESSLYREYTKDDPVLTDPDSVNAKGWEVTKKVYLDGQNVNLDLERFKKRLLRAHEYLATKKWKQSEKHV